MNFYSFCDILKISAKWQAMLSWPQATKTACWGPPQTRSLGPHWPEVVASLCSLFFIVSTAPVPSFCLALYSPADNQYSPLL